MGNIVGIDLNLDEKYIEASVQEIVKAAIVSALGDPTQILKNAVDNTVNSYVDREGKKCRKDSYYSRPYLDWLAEKTVEKVVREEIEKLVEENKEQFANEIREILKTKKFREDTAAGFITCLMSGATDAYKMPITLNFKKHGED